MLRAENDYKVNLKTEIMIEYIYDKLNGMAEKTEVRRDEEPKSAEKGL